MKNIFTQGATKTFVHIVTAQDVAAFNGEIVHAVYSTFCLVRDAEWCSRLFVLDMKEDMEEGIGTSITIQHCSPALVGSTVTFISTFEAISPKGEIQTSFTASVGTRLIATGTQGQKILSKQKINDLFTAVNN